MRLTLVLLAATLALPGCTAMRNFDRGLAKGAEVLETASEMVAKAQATWSKVSAKVEEIDTDKDGRLSLTEIIAAIVAAGSAAGGTIIARNAKSNARKSVLEARVSNLEEAG